MGGVFCDIGVELMFMSLSDGVPREGLIRFIVEQAAHIARIEK